MSTSLLIQTAVYRGDKRTSQMSMRLWLVEGVPLRPGSNTSLDDNGQGTQRQPLLLLQAHQRLSHTEETAVIGANGFLLPREREEGRQEMATHRDF